MKASERNLLLQIARNPEPQKVFDLLKKGKQVESPYSEIVNAQLDMGIKEMHLPEPWSGHLSEAQVMIISSNPSISADENFPTKKWSDDEIIHFFDNRFSENQGNVSRFWQSMAKHVSWIFKDADGKDTLEILDEYVVTTEIVHCKSKNEIGIEACAEEEAKFLDSILSAFNGTYIIIFGSPAKSLYESGVFTIKNKPLKIAVLPHPNAHGVTDAERRSSLLAQLGK